MADTRKTVNIRYRALDDFGGHFTRRNLQSSVAAALQHKIDGVTLKESVVSRQMIPEVDYGRLFINQIVDKSGGFFGQLVRLEEGATVPLVNTKSGKSYFDLEQTNTPAGYEHMKGIIYFFIMRNHVLFIEDDLRMNRLEDYLTWLLTDQSGVIGEDARVILSPELLGQNADGKQLAKIDRAVIKSGLVTARAEVENEVEIMKIRDVQEANNIEIMKLIGMAEPVIENLTERGTELELTIQIRFKSGRSLKPISAAETARLFRHTDQDEITLEGPDGRTKGQFSLLLDTEAAFLFGPAHGYLDLIDKGLCRQSSGLSSIDDRFHDLWA